MGQGDDRLIDMAAKQALRSPILDQAQPQQEPMRIDLVQLCSAGILKPKQVFDFLKAQFGDRFPFEWEEEKPIAGRNATEIPAYQLGAVEALEVLDCIAIAIEQCNQPENMKQASLIVLESRLREFVDSLKGGKF